MAEVQVVLYLFLTFALGNQSVRTIVQLFNSFISEKVTESERCLHTWCDFSDSFGCTLSEGRFLGGFCSQVVGFGMLRGGRAQRAGWGGWATCCCQM